MKKLPLKQEAEIVRRLSNLVSAGQGIIESLGILSESYPLIKNVSLSIQNGKSLCSSIKESQRFSPLTIKIIEVGELTGTLPTSLLRLSVYLRHKFELKSKIINACIYPLVIGFLTFCLVFFLMLYILPKLLPVFDSLKIPLPWSTKLLLSFSHFLTTFWYVLMVGIIILICVALKYRVKLKRIKGIRNMFRSLFIISFFQSLGIMLQSQISIIQALHLVKESEHDTYHKKLLSHFIAYLEKGKSLSFFISEHSGDFGTIAAHFVKVGELTGGLAQACIHVSEYVEYDFMLMVDRCMKLFEPFLIVFIGGIVGFISLALISPLYELSRISTI